MRIIRMLFWVALFLVSTFAFSVLFQYGTSNYMANAQTVWNSIVSAYKTKVIGAPPADAAKK